MKFPLRYRNRDELFPVQHILVVSMKTISEPQEGTGVNSVSRKYSLNLKLGRAWNDQGTITHQNTLYLISFQLKSLSITARDLEEYWFTTSMM